MSGYAYVDADGLAEYELTCDSCQAGFDCGDDSYYNWRLLCESAESDEWRIAPGRDGVHLCPACAAEAPPEAKPADPSPARPVHWPSVSLSERPGPDTPASGLLVANVT
ncbi:MAG: hypothetical protein ACRDXX_05320 [Stackebrandtia sp.]